MDAHRDRIDNDFDAYAVVEGISSQAISNAVTNALSIGFQLYGSLIVRGNTFFQPVVLRADERVPITDRLRRAKDLLRKLRA